MTKEVEQFHQLVLQDTSLKERLKQSGDRESFLNLAVELGKQNGYSFTYNEAKAYISQNLLAIAQQFL
jgi:Nif11 domain